MAPRVVRCQVKVLEEWLGAPLLRRCHNQVLLIPMGRNYLQAVSEPLERIASATERVWQSEMDRPIAISCYPTFALRWLVPQRGDFCDQHPEIDVQLTTTLQLVDFTRGDVDAAILVGEGGQTWPRLEAKKLVDVDFLPVRSPQLCDGENALTRPEKLVRCTLVNGMPRRDDWQHWVRFAGVGGVDAQKVLRSTVLISRFRR